MKAATNVVEKQQVLEVGSMDIIPRTFMEKKAAKYVEIQGLDNAIYRLGQLASRNQRAREMLDIVMDWKERSEEDFTEEEPQPETQMQTRQLTETFHRSLNQTYSVQNQKKSPKEHLDDMLTRIGIGYTEVGIDKEWRPVINASFKDHPHINGKRLFVGKEDKQHLWHLWKNDITVPFHVEKVTDDLIIGHPDMTRFFAVKERRRTIKSSTFKGVSGRGVYTDETDKKVIIEDQDDWKRFISKEGVWEFEVVDENDEGVYAKPVRYLEEESYFEATLSNGFVIQTDATEKKVYIPKKFQKEAEKDGVYKMKILKETEEKLFAKPVKHLKDAPKYIIGTPTKRNGRFHFQTDDTEMEVIVPARFRRKMKHLPGLWKLEVMDLRTGRMICKPFKPLSVKRSNNKPRRQSFKKKQVKKQFSSRSLEELKKNGRVVL